MNTFSKYNLIIKSKYTYVHFLPILDLIFYYYYHYLLFENYFKILFILFFLFDFHGPILLQF